MIIVLLDTLNKTTREIEIKEENLFSWIEGNFSCDCNRASFFYGTTGRCTNHNSPQRYQVIEVIPTPEGYTISDFNS